MGVYGPYVRYIGVDGVYALDLPNTHANSLNTPSF